MYLDFKYIDDVSCVLLTEYAANTIDAVFGKELIERFKRERFPETNITS